MSNNPYAAPPGAGGPPNAGYAAAKVQGPAIALIAFSGIVIGLQVLGLLMNLLGIGLGAAAANGQGGDQALMAMMQGTIGIISAIIGIGLHSVVLVGGLKMKKLESYGLAMAASIIAVLPCSLCCLAGIPIGIWALVTLNDQGVKSAFH